MVFNATFNNISATSWRSVLLVEETGVPKDIHRPVKGRKSKDIQYNGGQKERDKGINNDLQTATQKTKD
jgi:hypothetical protein